MTIDPRYGVYFSIIAAIVSGLLGAGATFTDLFGAEHTKTLLGVLVLANIIINAINAVLHMIPAQKGPLGAAQFMLGPKT